MIVASKEALGSCVRAHHDGVGGKVILIWDVRPDGAVDNVGVRDREHRNKSLAHCLADVARTWRFLATETGGAAIAFPMKY